jgi:hypothetical protein
VEDLVESPHPRQPVVRFFPRAGGLLPYLGVAVFVLLAVTWFTAAPDFFAGDD